MLDRQYCPGTQVYVDKRQLPKHGAADCTGRLLVLAYRTAAAVGRPARC